MRGRKGKIFPPSPPVEFIAVAHLSTMSATNNNIANEKGSISDSNGVSVLPVHTYARNTTPQPRVIASPSPLWVFALDCLAYVKFPD